MVAGEVTVNKTPVFWNGRCRTPGTLTVISESWWESLRLHHWYLAVNQKSLFKWKIVLKGYINMYFEHTTFHLKLINTYSFCMQAQESLKVSS